MCNEFCLIEELCDRAGEVTALLNIGSIYAGREQKNIAKSLYMNAQNLVQQINHQSLAEKVQQLLDAL
jgi:hypothetical protein